MVGWVLGQRVYMKTLALDFANPVPRYNTVMIVVLLLLAGSVMTFFVLQQQKFVGEIDRINRQVAGAKNAGSVKSALNPELERQTSAARQTQRALNIPWEGMLNALELAKQGNAGIRLRSLQPKPEKGEVLITGTALEFDDLVKYLNSLRKQPGFGDAILLNQHWEQNGDASNADGQDNLMFNLSVVWLPS
jgi:hypothetical protein